MGPKCPLCGAVSSWRQFPSDRTDLRTRFPEECHFCKEEDAMHWRNWEQGVDVTQFGGKHIRNPQPHELNG